MRTELSPTGLTTARPVTFHRTVPASSRPPRKAFVRRKKDRTALLRQSFQTAFLLLNLWMGARFYVFVRAIETSASSVPVARPAGVEGWLPIAALMNLKYLVVTGSVLTIHPAGVFLLIAFLLISFVFRKAFCSWLCPIGTLSEWLWQGGRALFRRTLSLPRWADIPLRSLKYVLMGFFVVAVLRMSTTDIRAFLESPYGVVADVKMLSFFRHLDATAGAVLAFLAAASVLVPNFWCRYACPYGALLGLVSWLSPVRIRRDPDACIDCAKCAKACPARLPVDVAGSISSPECTGCVECVTVCPAKGALAMSAARRRALPGWAIAAGIAALFLGVVGAAKLTGNWHTELDPLMYRAVIRQAADAGHP